MARPARAPKPAEAISGHNSGDDEAEAPAGFAKEQLKSFLERIERLQEEKQAVADDIKDVFAEAKANGFNVKALRTILKMRKEDPDERREHEAIVDLYMHALGIIPFEQTPLGAQIAGGAA
ncbi:DUF2312 domain-containing protein [Xanthobacter flavus]|uniref:DUF2312 domain-containing protein n=1 Tax=Xanthobacter flavus TaxID=281 RepID=UPI00372CA684